MVEDAMGVVSVVLVILSLTAIAGLAIFVIPPWIRAALSGVPVNLLLILAMRLRGTAPMKVVDAYIALRKRGIDAPLHEIEIVCLAEKGRVATPADIADKIMDIRAQRRAESPDKGLAR